MKLLTTAILVLMLLPLAQAGAAQPGLDFLCRQDRIEQVARDGERPTFLERGYTYEFDGAEWYPTNAPGVADSYNLGVKVTGDDKTVTYESTEYVHAFVLYSIGNDPTIYTEYYPGGRGGTFTTKNNAIVAVFACHARGVPEPVEVPEAPKWLIGFGFLSGLFGVVAWRKR
jgi:hypothetical protein